MYPYSLHLYLFKKIVKNSNFLIFLLTKYIYIAGDYKDESWRLYLNEHKKSTSPNYF